jgi:hypothetical protein
MYMMSSSDILLKLPKKNRLRPLNVANFIYSDAKIQRNIVCTHRVFCTLDSVCPCLCSYLNKKLSTNAS